MSGNCAGVRGDEMNVEGRDLESGMQSMRTSVRGPWIKLPARIKGVEDGRSSVPGFD